MIIDCINAKNLKHSMDWKMNDRDVGLPEENYMKNKWNVLRWLFASYYLVAGIAVALLLVGVIQPDEIPDFGKGINELLTALFQTGYGTALLAATYTISGGLILNNRTAHFGLITLSPVVLVIFLTHCFVEGGSPVWGTMHLVVLLALVWRFRQAYLPLFDFSGKFQAQ